MHIDCTGQRYPFADSVLGRPLAVMYGWGERSIGERCPPQNWNCCTKVLVLSKGSKIESRDVICVLPIYTHCRRNDPLNVWIPIIAKMIQKNNTKKATCTNRGAAFFRDRKIVWEVSPRLEESYASSLSYTEQPKNPETTEHLKDVDMMLRHHTCQFQYQRNPITNHGNEIHSVERVP